VYDCSFQRHSLPEVGRGKRFAIRATKAAKLSYKINLVIIARSTERLQCVCVVTVVLTARVEAPRNEKPRNLHASCTFEVGGTCNNHGSHKKCIWYFCRKSEGKRPLGRPRRRWKVILESSYGNRVWRCGWMDLAQDRDLWWALVNTIMNLRFP